MLVAGLPTAVISRQNRRLLEHSIFLLPALEVTSQLVDEFLHMVRERTGEQLEEWLKKVEASHLQAFQPFVTGVQKDKEAVLAGLTLPWSNDYVA
jgi:transposase